MLQEIARPVIDHRISKEWRRREANFVMNPADYDDGLLAVAGRVMIVCYAGVFAIAAFTFWGTREALFAITIGIGVATIQFGILVLMMGVRSTLDQRWQKDTDRRRSAIVEVSTGPIRRWEAIAQIISIPIAILLGFALLAVNWVPSPV